MTTPIPLSAPVFIGREREYLTQCIDTRWVAAGGPFIGEFEQRFADFHGEAAAVATVNGTAALHVALVELGIGPGDEVVLPSLTFVATANVVRYAGATPVFADVDPHTYTLDPESLRASLSSRTRAVLVVHLYGHPADMDPILAIAAEHGIAVVEDATEALGATYRGRLCGTLGDVGCFSFNGNKVITTGGGGMVLASDEERLRHIRYLTLQAREPGPEYVHGEVGFNYAMGNVQAALGLAQLESLPHFLERKRAIAGRYREALADAPHLTFAPEAEWAHSNFWLQSVLVEPGHGSPAEVIARLADEAIQARPFFTPLHRLPPYSDDGGPELPVSCDLHARGVSIPSSPDLDEAAQDRVIAALLG